MGGFHFYPRLTKDLVERAGYRASEYSFSYMSPEGEALPLSVGGGRVATVSDPLDAWSLKSDGIVLRKEIIFDYPDVLMGPEAVAPKGAQVLPCLLWSIKKLSLAGVIPPDIVQSGCSLACVFQHEFAPGALAGDLTLDLVLYLAKAADTLECGEELLMNEAGVMLGNIEDPFVIDIEGGVIDFPIEEFEEDGGPLWRMQFEPWDDPREDLFSESSFTLLLNSKHPECPKLDKGRIVNQTLLQEIMAEAYYLIFEKVREDEDAWDDLKSDSNLSPDSICSVLHWFTERDGDEQFDWTTAESRLASIKRIVDLSFMEASDAE